MQLPRQGNKNFKDWKRLNKKRESELKMRRNEKKKKCETGNDKKMSDRKQEKEKCQSTRNEEKINVRHEMRKT